MRLDANYSTIRTGTFQWESGVNLDSHFLLASQVYFHFLLGRLKIWRFKILPARRTLPQRSSVTQTQSIFRHSLIPYPLYPLSPIPLPQPEMKVRDGGRRAYFFFLQFILQILQFGVTAKYSVGGG